MTKLLQVLAACQGFFILGFIFNITWLAIKYGIKENQVKIYLSTELIGELFIMAFTIRTVYESFFFYSLFWQILLIVGYGFLDVSLVIAFRRIAKNQLKREMK